MLSGLSLGFDTGILDLPTESLQCKNLLSAIKQPDIVSELLQLEFTKGYIIKPFDSPPFNLYRINPIGIAENKYLKKPRLIVDLSAPNQNDNHAIINSLINKGFNFEL